MSKIAVIQIRGAVKLSKKIKSTLEMLNLKKKNSCIIEEANNVNIGMVNVVKDYVTWGEINEQVIKELLLKRGKIVGNKLLDEDYLIKNIKLNLDSFIKEFINNNKKLRDIPGFKPYFRLKPPIKGFERGGIKQPYSLGGALGYRKEKINELIMRML